MLYLSNCLIRCICKKSLLSFSYFSMVIKKNMQNQNKFVGNSPCPQTTSYARKTTSYAHKTTSYAHKTTSYVHKATSYAFKTYKFDS